MEKVYLGVDISSKSFDTAFCLENKKQYHHKSFSNDLKGFQSFLTYLKSFESSDFQLVIESTGLYHTKLTLFCYQSDLSVFVVNPLSVKHFGRAFFQRAKTDAQDAVLISLYAKAQPDALIQWKPESDYIVELKQLYQIRENFIKQRTALKNQNHAYEQSPLYSNLGKTLLGEQIASLTEKIEGIDQAIEVQIIKEEGKILELLKSIPGIGPKTAWMLILLTEGFQKFEQSKSFAAYVGIAPRVYQSGTSVKGKGHICKMGKASMRHLLYIAACSASRHNPACKDFYQRLRQKGKSFKVAIIAVANKLLKQVFAIIRKKQSFNPDFQKN